VPNIFASNENLGSIPPLVGMEIMELVRKSPNQKVSLFDVFDKLKARPSWAAPKTVYFALAFLFSTGLIDFDGVHVSVGENAVT
jgi:hypothetical protein